LSAGYSGSTELYARQDRYSNVFGRHNFLANGVYRLSPELIVYAYDAFAYNRETAVASPESFSTGRQNSLSNTFAPGVIWRMTARNTLTLGASYGVLRFGGVGSGVNSDTYRFETTLRHAFTPRLSGLFGYGFAYLDAKGQGSSTTHTPRAGFEYQFTPTLSGSISGGAAITEIGGETRISPAGNVGLVKTFSFGSVGLQYSRGVAVAGGFGGTTDTQVVSGSVTLEFLQRGLYVVVNPAYSKADSVSSQQTAQVDVESYSLGLAAMYRVARYVSLFGEYRFLRQRTAGSSAQQVDVDQNRIRIGVQFGYPFTFN